MKKSKLIIKRVVAMAIAAAMLLSLPVKGSVAYAETDNKTETVTSSEETDAKTEDTDKEKTDEEAEKDSTEDQEEELSDYDRALKEAADARHALQNDPNHVHHYRWIARMNESESADGTINYMCEECDKVWYFRPYPAFYCFQGDIARQIEVAPENFTVKVKTSLFITFNKQVMEALAKRPDVSLQVSFLRNEYKGDRLSFVIPAGEDTMSLLSEEGYAGFIFLGNKYGMTVEVKQETNEAEAQEAETTQEVQTEEIKTDSDKTTSYTTQS